VPRGYLKPFAAVRHVHYAAYAALALREAVRGRMDAIVAITLETYAEAVRYCGNRSPRTAIQAQFSLSYGAAWALLRGDLDPTAYRPDALTDAQVCRIESMIALKTADRPDDKRYARLHVAFADGTAEHAEAIDIPGDPLNPMAPDAVHAKFVRFAGETLGEVRADAFARRLLDADPAAPCRAAFAPLLQG
jgi:2-methylcitrate dehydratase PrpD